LGIVESFLVRRAIRGIEPTGLHAVFKSMWLDIGKKVLPDEVAGKLKSITTQDWPSNAEVMESILARPLYKSRVVKFLLMEMELSQNADLTELDFQIEHIMPQTLTQAWIDSGVKPEIHEKLKDTIGNLVTLSEPLNKEVSQALYPEKRPKYRSKSKFALARDVAERYDSWTPEVIQGRSREIGEWAVHRWPK